MEENEQKEIIVDSEETNEEETTEKVETPKEEKPKAKPKRSPQEELDYFEGRAKRLRKQLGVETKETEEAPAKPNDLDYGQKAYLKSYDIKGADELALVKNWISRTGDDIDTLVVDDVFHAKLKGLRDARAVADATPKGTKRTAQPVTDTLEYWQGKIESGQAEFKDAPEDIRRKILNNRVALEKEGNKFSRTPIVTGGIAQ